MHRTHSRWLLTCQCHMASVGYCSLCFSHMGHFNPGGGGRWRFASMSSPASSPVTASGSLGIGFLARAAVSSLRSRWMNASGLISPATGTWGGSIPSARDPGSQKALCWATLAMESRADDPTGDEAAAATAAAVAAPAAAPGPVGTGLRGAGCGAC